MSDLSPQLSGLGDSNDDSPMLGGDAENEAIRRLKICPECGGEFGKYTTVEAMFTNEPVADIYACKSCEFARMIWRF